MTTLHTAYIPQPHLSRLDADELHQLTMSLFRSATLPGDEGARRAGANILWRAIPGGGVQVTSDIEPTDVDHLGGPVLTGVITPDFQAGERVAFHVTYDAVTRVRGRETKALDPMSWLVGKMKGVLTDTSFHGVGAHSTRRRGAALEQVHAAGHATVADPTQLAHLIRCGVGRSKAFGCGMLTVSAL